MLYEVITGSENIGHGKAVVDQIFLFSKPFVQYRQGPLEFPGGNRQYLRHLFLFGKHKAMLVDRPERLFIV